MEIKTGFLLPEVVLLAGVQYKKIPGYVNAYAGDNGKIAFIRSNGSVKFPAEFEWKTTKGTYKYIKLIDDDFSQVTKAVHQLVCKTYHGDPVNDGFIYEPNHRNGNKHDNKPENLEWLNRSKNIQHAYNSGLCQQGLRIEVTDIISKEVRNYNSLSFLSREMNIPRHQLREIIARHRQTPFQGRYVFVLDDSQDKKITRHQSCEVIFKDYVRNEITITRTAYEASEKTGVKSGTISLRVRDKNTKLLSRYVFQAVGTSLKWPEYSVEEALDSEKAYNKSC